MNRSTNSSNESFAVEEIGLGIPHIQTAVSSNIHTANYSQSFKVKNSPLTMEDAIKSMYKYSLCL
jgi:hypothetical protein